jgi:hypothetical protein
MSLTDEQIDEVASSYKSHVNCGEDSTPVIHYYHADDFARTIESVATAPLLERIKELEQELLESARLHGMGSEREAALMGKVDRLEQELAKTKLTKVAAWVKESDLKELQSANGMSIWALKSPKIYWPECDVKEKGFVAVYTGSQVGWDDDQMIRFAWTILVQGNTSDSLDQRLETFRQNEILRGNQFSKVPS